MQPWWAEDTSFKNTLKILQIPNIWMVLYSKQWMGNKKQFNQDGKTYEQRSQLNSCAIARIYLHLNHWIVMNNNTWTSLFQCVTYCFHHPQSRIEHNCWALLCVKSEATGNLWSLSMAPHLLLLKHRECGKDRMPLLFYSFKTEMDLVNIYGPMQHYES